MNNHYTDDRHVVNNFDPDLDDMVTFIDSLEVHIDGARVGTVEKGKTAFIIRYCDHPDVRDLVNIWRYEEITDPDANVLLWEHATWGAARESMEDTFGDVTLEQQAVDTLLGVGDDGADSLKQDCKIPVHYRRINRICNAANKPFVWESEDTFDKKKYAN